jgi:hypothetical protein
VTAPELRACDRTLPIGHALKESHLTVAPRIDRSLRVVSIALKFFNYAHSSTIDRFIDSASVEPFFDQHKQASTAVQVAIAKRGKLQMDWLSSEDLKGEVSIHSGITLRWFNCTGNNQMAEPLVMGEERLTRHHRRAALRKFLLEGAICEDLLGS